MTSINPFEISFYLDVRNKLLKHPGCGSLYLQVYSPSEKRKNENGKWSNGQKYFRLKKYVTPESWKKILKSFAGSGSNLNEQQKELRTYCIAIQTEANKYNSYSKAKTLKQFSALFNSDTNSDADTLLIWDRFNQFIERKIEGRKSEGTIKAYRDAKASFLRFDPTPQKLIYDIDISWLHEFIEYHVEIGNSEETAKSYLRQLRAVYTSAWKKGIISGRENPFADDDAPSLDSSKRRTRQFNLSKEQIETLAELEPTSFHMKKAKDIFFFLFMFSGLRFSDMLILEYDWILTDELGKRIDFDPVKTKGRTGLKGEVWITPEIQEIMDRYPGKGKYIFDFLEDDMSLEAIKKKKHSIIANVNDNLTKLAHKGVKLPSKLSTYHARYSAASFISRETGASVNEVSEQMVNSPKMAAGYIDTPEKKKAMQSVLSSVLKKNRSN